MKSVNFFKQKSFSKTFCLSVVVFSVFIGTIFSQSSAKYDISKQSARILAKAKNAFDRGDYSGAMTICEEARIARRNEVAASTSIIGYILNTPDVKKYGPYISDLIPILEEREEYDALKIINTYVDKKGADAFDNSLPKLYEYLKSLKDYPESDFLLAKIYRVEGEYDMSMDYLERARSHSDILDVPAQKYDILYEMADLAKVQGDDNKYESTLLLVVANDGLYKNTTIEHAVKKAVKLDRKGVDLAEYFLHFFRNGAINSMTAYFELGDLYEKWGDKEKSFMMTAFGVIVGFSHTLEILDDRLGTVPFDETKRQEIGYFFAECARNKDVLDWSKKRGLWQGFFNLAMRARLNGWNDFADSFLTKLEKSCPDTYWQKAAREVLAGARQPVSEKLAIDIDTSF